MANVFIVVALLEVQSLGIRRRRIKRAGSNTFVAIDKLGRPYVQVRQLMESLQF